jgi:hypothetical protein
VVYLESFMQQFKQQGASKILNVTPIEEPFKNWVEIKKYLSKHEAWP